MRQRLSVVLADDNLIVRSGLRALLEAAPDIEVAREARDYDELVSAAAELRPDAIVTDIRMPPGYESEGIAAAEVVRLGQPGVGVVLLSQFDDAELAFDFLSRGPAGLAYLLKDRVAVGEQLADAVRTVCAGGSLLDPAIVQRLMEGELPRLSSQERALLRDVAAGQSLERLARLSRLLPDGIAGRVVAAGAERGALEQSQATVLMADVRGYSTIAEDKPAAALALLLNEQRRALSEVVRERDGMVVQFVGDSMMAVFDRAADAVDAAAALHEAQERLHTGWGLGIGVATGTVAAGLLGSEERLEYSFVGDVVNLTQRLQALAAAGDTVLSEPTFHALSEPPSTAKRIGPLLVKGRRVPVTAYRLARPLRRETSARP